MDKKKVGEFLKQLRTDRGLSQEQMVEAFSIHVGVEEVITTATISKWERGETFPNILNIKDLATFFNVSVDEIFNGEKEMVMDLKKEYFTYNPEWIYGQPADAPLFEMGEEQELKIEKRFDELLTGLVDFSIAPSEEREFDFLCENFYTLSKYGRQELGEKIDSCKTIYGNEWSNNDDGKIIGKISELKFVIRKNSALMHESSLEEKVWEAQKYFDCNFKVTFNKDLCNKVVDAREILSKRLRCCKAWEKDILLALIQKYNVTHAYGKVVNQDLFYKTFGYEYDTERITKDAIKLLIESGACLNQSLLGYFKETEITINVFDQLVNDYQEYKKPLLIPVFENGNYSYYAVKNTPANRKLAYKDEGTGLSPETIRELEEHLVNFGTQKILHLKAWHGGESVEKSEEYMLDVVRSTSMADYIKSRDEQKTQELLKCVDSLSLKELREKYFTKEIGE